MDKSIRVLIADDHPLMREGLKKLLELEEDMEVVGIASDGEDALEKIKEVHPDVALMDINMPAMNGIQALRCIRHEEIDVRVIILTIHDSREYLLETINLGADGYVLKDADMESLVEAIRTVSKGGSYIHPTLSSELVRVYKTNEDISSGRQVTKQSNLTRREFEVLCLISEGNSNKDISEKLFISEKTVKNHVSSIFKKIHVNDRTQAAIYAIKNKINPKLT